MLIGISDFNGAGGSRILFSTGTIIRHRIYGYRGVVVAADPSCKAGDKWYFANKTQPDRNQPWYHVLVHNSGGISTYVAQSNLEDDASGEPIEHPRLGFYFSSFEQGRYLVHDSGSGGCGI